ncbi:MAG: hypothetical protein IJ120_04415 [Solobacterium sp.]|nr:hypothetical protein [Solobacterium sp.]
MLGDKLKYLLASAGYKQVQYAARLNRSKQSVNKKFRSNAFSVYELCDILEMVDHHLVITDKSGKTVFELTKDDVLKDDKGGLAE